MNLCLIMDYDNDYPAGSLLSASDHVAWFMLAYLQEGCYQGACILQS